MDMRHSHLRKLDYGQIRIMLELHRHGWSPRRIADHLGVSRQNIAKLLRRRGLQPHRYISTKDRPGGLFTGVVRQEEPVNRRERDEAGIVVTLRCQETGELDSLHIPGKRIEALHYLALLIDHRLPGEWRIVCYSTPETILGDMRGRREVDSQRKTFARTPEENAVGLIGRIDLLDPSLRRSA